MKITWRALLGILLDAVVGLLVFLVASVLLRAGWERGSWGEALTLFLGLVGLALVAASVLNLMYRGFVRDLYLSKVKRDEAGMWVHIYVAYFAQGEVRAGSQHYWTAPYVISLKKPRHFNLPSSHLFWFYYDRMPISGLDEEALQRGVMLTFDERKQTPKVEPTVQTPSTPLKDKLDELYSKQKGEPK